MVDDPLITLHDGTSVNASDYVSAAGRTVNAARVRVDGLDDCLHLYVEDNGVWTLTQYTEAWTDDGEGNWTGTGWTPASLGVSLGQFDDAQYSFLVELGFVDDGGTWTTLAVSDVASRNSLARHVSLGGVGTQPQTPWQPLFVVPEPTGGLLLLLGAAALALRRRRPDG